MRLVAEIAEDLRLIGVFVENQDAHFVTASLVLRKAIDKISKLERQQAKAVNFGFIYGMQPKKFVVYALAQYGVGLSLKQATDFHRRYFENYYGIARWHAQVTSEGQRRGYSRTLSGRIRYMDPKAWNEYMNNPVQGTGADGLKLSMREVHRRLRHPKYGGRAWLVHHVHDELIVECDDDPDMIASVKRDLEEGMIEGMSPFLKRVPIVVDAHHGPNWAAAK
jgi:DNA polymerase I-like protein with 3'-5' exonuclease and polymerase domains